MLTATGNPEIGMIASFSETTSIETQESISQSPDLFGSLVNVYQSNTCLLNELRSINLKVTRARDYLSRVGSNPVLGSAHLAHLRIRRSAVLTILRANRLQADRLLAGPDSAALSA